MAEKKSANAVVVISSHVVRGSVGNRAAVFALEALSFPVWSVPTVVLPWHPGHGPSTRLVPQEAEFSNFFNDIANAQWTAEIGAVYSGYLAKPWQAAKIAGLVSRLKKNNPALVYLCDPVIGDEKGLYVAEETAAEIRKNLLPLADITTPNRYELAWLASQDPASSISQLTDQLDRIPCAAALVTSAPMKNPGKTGNLYRENEEIWLAEHDAVADPPNGPGDLAAAIFLGHRLSGKSLPDNIESTTASVFEILKKCKSSGLDELPLESSMASIISPSERISIRKINGPG